MMYNEETYGLKKKNNSEKNLKDITVNLDYTVSSSLDYTVSSFSCYVMHELIESDIKLKIFYKAEETIKWKAAMEWEKIFANHTSDKVLIYKIYKEPI